MAQTMPGGLLSRKKPIQPFPGNFPTNNGPQGGINPPKATTTGGIRLSNPPTPNGPQGGINPPKPTSGLIGAKPPSGMGAPSNGLVPPSTGGINQGGMYSSTAEPVPSGGPTAGRNTGIVEGEYNPNAPRKLPPSPAPGPTPVPTPEPSPKVIQTPTAVSEDYTATDAASRDMTATNADVSNMTANTRTVNQPTETVQGQLGAMFESGSPLLEKAQADAMLTSNNRGLINSSMAAQAGTAALLDRATPIAQADANIYNQAAGQNQQFTNQAAAQNAQLGTQTNLSNADAQNRSASQNAQLGTQANLANAAATNAAAAQNAQLGTQTSQINADIALKQQTAREQNETNIVMANADNATKVELANIEAEYKVLMQSNVSATEIYKSTMSNISGILMDPNLSAEAKSAAINYQVAMLENGMALVGGMNGMEFTDANGQVVGLEDLLNFTGSADGGAGNLPNPIPPPAPPPPQTPQPDTTTGG
jgi:hypothetical protein